MASGVFILLWVSRLFVLLLHLVSQKPVFVFFKAPKSYGAILDGVRIEFFGQLFLWMS